MNIPKNKMRPSIKKKWVAALRSGDYKQGRDQLRNEKNEFCCLGVLCNIHAQEHPRIAAQQEDPLSYMGEEGDCPDEVEKWAGLKGRIHEPLFDPVTQEFFCLIELNDFDQLSFDEIADVIERSL